MITKERLQDLIKAEATIYNGLYSINLKDAKIEEDEIVAKTYIKDYEYIYCNYKIDKWYESEAEAKFIKRYGTLLKLAEVNTIIKH